MTPAPMRVLLLNNYLPPRGGAEAHVEGLLGLLRGAGHAAELHAPGDASGWPALRDRVHNPGVRRFVASRIREFRPDVVHVHNFLRRLSVAPFLAARDAGVPTLLTVHDFQLFCPRTWAVRSGGEPCRAPSLPLCMFGGCRGGLDGWGGRAVYALNAIRLRWAGRAVRDHADRIVAPSRALAERLSGTLGREVGHLPHPFPPAPPFAPPPNRDLLFLGRVSREKGLAELLRAMDPATRLTVAGDGPDREALERRGGPGVRFEGRVDPARVPDLLRSHGALVVPSVWMENSPLVVHEALAAGRPVLGSVRGGIPELVEDGVHGFLFDPLDGESVATALERWRTLPPEGLEAMARRARERAAEGGGPAGWLPRLLAEYARAAKEAAR